MDEDEVVFKVIYDETKSTGVISNFFNKVEKMLAHSKDGYI